jgi:hypothetical protein
METFEGNPQGEFDQMHQQWARHIHFSRNLVKVSIVSGKYSSNQPGFASSGNPQESCDTLSQNFLFSSSLPHDSQDFPELGSGTGKLEPGKRFAIQKGSPHLPPVPHILIPKVDCRKKIIRA